MKVTIIKSTESSRGGFINTIEGVKTIKVLGVNKSAKLRFILKTDESVEVGSEHEVDLTQFNQEVRSFEGVNQETGEVETKSATWLHVRGV